jgi:Leucine-rich repeat (LRR) protein
MLCSLPSGITQLHNLRRLGLEDTPINQVPKGISKLTSLNDLQGFLVSGGCHNITIMQDGWSLEELGPLLQLRKLSLIKLERALPCSRDSLIIDKMYLRQLSLECTERTDIPYIVEDLTIWGFFGTRYPTWLYTNINLSNVLYLKLVNCKSCVCLPPIGQLPNLKYLKIKGAL